MAQAYMIEQFESKTIFKLAENLEIKKEENRKGSRSNDPSMSTKCRIHQGRMADAIYLVSGYESSRQVKQDRRSNCNLTLENEKYKRYENGFACTLFTMSFCIQ